MKFNIGDSVITKVSKRGSYEPSFCRVNEKMTVDGIEKHGSVIHYICGFDGYDFTEDELMSVDEYKATL